MNYQEKTKNKQAGITLIALVVTIIVLLILAGISLNFMLSDDGILKKTNEAVDNWHSAENAKEFYEKESRNWINFLDEKNISWINWSFTNKDEATSILQLDQTDPIDKNLTETGKFIKSILQ